MEKPQESRSGVNPMNRLTQEQIELSNQLARNILDACNNLPPICGVAALVAVTGAVCFSEARGEMSNALERADSIAKGVKDVIDKLHREETGNGHEDGAGLFD